jgi:hypothetical protein
MAAGQQWQLHQCVDVLLQQPDLVVARAALFFPQEKKRQVLKQRERQQTATFKKKTKTKPKTLSLSLTG